METVARVYSIFLFIIFAEIQLKVIYKVIFFNDKIPTPVEESRFDIYFAREENAPC